MPDLESSSDAGLGEFTSGEWRLVGVVDSVSIHGAGRLGSGWVGVHAICSSRIGGSGESFSEISILLDRGLLGTESVSGSDLTDALSSLTAKLLNRRVNGRKCGLSCTVGDMGLERGRGVDRGERKTGVRERRGSWDGSDVLRSDSSNAE